jgi:hypothetical protein
MPQCKDCRYYKDGMCYREPPKFKPEARSSCTHPAVNPNDEACGEYKA